MDRRIAQEADQEDSHQVRIVWSRAASTDLVAIDDHIAKRDPIAALDMVEAIDSAVDRLSQFPRSGRPGRVAETRELVVAPFMVAYQIRRNHIDILRVIHGSRRWPRRF